MNPEVLNLPSDILRAWTSFEVLSPKSYKKKLDLALGQDKVLINLDDSHLPWEVEQQERPKKRLVYELILGSIELGPSFESLLRKYADNRPDKIKATGSCAIASIVLDDKGRPLDQVNNFVISSFAWGLPIALNDGGLNCLGDWVEEEESLVGNFKKNCLQVNEAEEYLPLKHENIEDMYRYLIDTLNLSHCDVIEPSFVIGRYEFIYDKAPPEPSLLNSFYLEDLGTVQGLAKKQKLTKGLSFYLGLKRLESRYDLLNNNRDLQKLLHPNITPRGRWPGNGRFPLALLQQAAVNATTTHINESGIVAVNGPPGTGKTTLLRDVIASRIIDRATVMVTYKNPEDAFRKTEHEVRTSGAMVNLHTIDSKLKGFEMVVASSNNKAVENVSEELPALEAVAGDEPSLRYFSSISDKVSGIKTWGLVSAVLGNSSNKYQFTQKFWRDLEGGFSTLLNNVVGGDQYINETNESGDLEKRLRKVVELENTPASKSQALERWQVAKQEFTDALRCSEEAFLPLQQLQQSVEAQMEYVQLLQATKGAKQSIEKSLIELTEELQLRQAQADNLIARAKQTKRELNKINAAKPNLFTRLFRRSAFRLWSEQRLDLADEYKELKLAADRSIDEEKNSRSHRSNLERQLEENNLELKRIANASDELSHTIEDQKMVLGVAVPDEQFLSKSHEEKQISSVWINEATSLKRDDVFVKAMALHRCFAEAAADPMRQNLALFFNYDYGASSLGSGAKDKLIPDLWSTFFLAVPVVSTTFASVTRMFSKLPPETLGWLLVDEAGQALPQAIVGAMMRCKNTVVVGDPLQIEPVVSLPSELTEEICKHVGIAPVLFNAPEASVQTLADSASPSCARMVSGSGYRDVGSPLLVHRRCDSPMFEISNEIAYNNKMVQAKSPETTETALGRSCWFNVQGSTISDKWCEEEGRCLIELLKQMKEAGEEPDLYIVTPFKVVQDNLRTVLETSGVLDDWVSENVRDWVFSHVGTVHTVQGREAGTVFFVLGAAGPSQNGARAWAGKTPNLLNVAVTRAKSFFYVVGNRELWKSAGCFSTLDSYLPESL